MKKYTYKANKKKIQQEPINIKDQDKWQPAHSSNFKITVAQTRKPNVFHTLKYLPNSIKYVGEQVEINGTPGGNIPKSASVLFFMSL